MLSDHVERMGSEEFVKEGRKAYLVGATARVICQREKEEGGMIGKRKVSQREKNTWVRKRGPHPGQASVTSYNTQSTWLGLYVKACESEFDGPNRRGRPLGRWKDKVEEYMRERY